MILGLLVGFLPVEVQALSLSLSPPQMGEAVRYGERSQDLPFALFSREWRVEGMRRAGQSLNGWAWLQSPFALVAHASWAASQRDLSLSQAELRRRLDPVRDRLAFAITLLPPEKTTRTYYVKIHQAGEVFDASYIESREDGPESGKGWVYLYCLFPAEKIDLQGTVILEVSDAHGDLLPFIFDLSRMR